MISIITLLNCAYNVAKKSNLISSISEFFKKLDQSFLMSSIPAFYGAKSKFNYIRIGLLGDMPGDDALDYLLASNPGGME